MFAFFLLGTSAALSVGIIVAVMRRAPEAYEDETGLTIIRNGPPTAARQRQKSVPGESRSSDTFPTFFHPHGKPAHARPAGVP
jgi:hypothetical protein